MDKSKNIIHHKSSNKELVAPDGGWGWMVAFAAGFSNLSTFPALQQFGLIFRDKFETIGISSAHTTTIINTNAAITACIGLANGPVFRTFTFRKVAFCGATVVFISLLLTCFANSAVGYLISFSFLYGAGMGITTSANSLALNTYFKQKRRIATGLSWTATGLGPIILPQIITALIPLLGQQGTLLVICGFSLHAVACALLLQPVERHLKEKNVEETENTINKTGNETDYPRNLSKFRDLSIVSSQYIYNEDDPCNAGYEIIEPGTPMLAKGNDGYFSTSKRSLNRLISKEGSKNNSELDLRLKNFSNNTISENASRKSSVHNLSDIKRGIPNNLGQLGQEPFKPRRKISISKASKIIESEIEDCPTLKAPQDLKESEKDAVFEVVEESENIYHKNDSFKPKFKYADEPDEFSYLQNNESRMSLKNTHDLKDDINQKYYQNTQSNQSLKNKYKRKSNNFNYENELLKLASEKLEAYLQTEDESVGEKPLLPKEDQQYTINLKEDEMDNTPTSLLQKIIYFFDLDLLMDFTFVNLMIGVTIAAFTELNFSILTPFILGDFGMTKQEVATFMSLLAGIDISIRFCIPFVAGKIGWQNNTFFLLGILTMAAGRIVLAHNHAYATSVIVAVVIGFGKGLRTVFMALVIPTYVPLEKLPGATGLQLITSGMFSLIMGPVVGWVKDNSSTATTLHCLNIFTFLTAISWTLEKFIRNRRVIHEIEKS